MLVDRPGEILTRDDIRRKLWPNGTIVEFNDSINTAIKKLRLALGDSAEEPRYVETVARRGYRLMVPVFDVQPTDPGPLPEAPNGQANSGVLQRRRLSLPWGIAALLAVGLLSVLDCALPRKTSARRRLCTCWLRRRKVCCPCYRPMAARQPSSWEAGFGFNSWRRENRVI